MGDGTQPSVRKGGVNNKPPRAPEDLPAAERVLGLVPQHPASPHSPQCGSAWLVLPAAHSCSWNYC